MVSKRWKTTSKKDNLNYEKMEDDLNWRRLQWKMTSMENALIVNRWEGDQTSEFPLKNSFQQFWKFQKYGRQPERKKGLNGRWPEIPLIARNKKRLFSFIWRFSSVKPKIIKMLKIWNMASILCVQGYKQKVPHWLLTDWRNEKNINPFQKRTKINLNWLWHNSKIT